MNQAFNPYLKAYEYIPDGEVRVFDDRVYIYGSHDRFGGMKFCLNDYVSYSASVENLSDWRYEGVIYRKTQDPRMVNGKYQLWAPDVIKGKDGKYYLYYCPDDRLIAIGVAVSDKPAGQFQFLGFVSHGDSTPYGEKDNDYLPFDPSIFIDDDGCIYLYTGNGPRIKRHIGKENKASFVLELEDDMITVKSGPTKLLPTLGDNDTSFAGHEFFEASSVRKINQTYYYVYSSVKLHELCYATSNKPNGKFKYGGVIISNCDVSASQPKFMNMIGNNHGCIQKIKNDWFVFYHRQTNQTMFSRQGCAEKIDIDAEGNISQVGLSSCGLNLSPLIGKGTYSAGIACHLYGKKNPVISHPLAMRNQHPYITQTQSDYDLEIEQSRPEPVQYITNCGNGMVAGFRSFNLVNLKSIAVIIRGKAKGKLKVMDRINGKVICSIFVEPTKLWTEFENKADIDNGISDLYFHYVGKGKFDFLSFTLTTEGE